MDTKSVEKGVWQDAAVTWLFRVLRFGLPCLVGWVAWVASGHLFDAQNEIGRLFSWLAVSMVLLALLQLFNIVAIDLPRRRKKKRFWENKRSNKI